MINHLTKKMAKPEENGTDALSNEEAGTTQEQLKKMNERIDELEQSITSYRKTIRVLLERGIENTIKTIRTLVANCSIEDIEILLQGIEDKNVKKALIDAGLFYSALLMEVEMAEFFLKKGANANGIDDDALLSLILDIEISYRDMNSYHSLDMMTPEEMEKFIKLNHGNTPSMCLASAENEELGEKFLNLLLKHKANINARNTHGMTARYIAKKRGNKKMARIFAKKGGINKLQILMSNLFRLGW